MAHTYTQFPSQLQFVICMWNRNDRKSESGNTHYLYIYEVLVDDLSKGVFYHPPAPPPPGYYCPFTFAPSSLCSTIYTRTPKELWYPINGGEGRREGGERKNNAWRRRGVSINISVPHLPMICRWPRFDQAIAIHHCVYLQEAWERAAIEWEIKRQCGVGRGGRGWSAYVLCSSGECWIKWLVFVRI